MEQHGTSSQIFIFESLLEFTKFVDNTMQVYKSELSKYEEELGLLLRQDMQNNPESELLKEIQSKLTSSKTTEQTDAKQDEAKDEKEPKDKKKEEREMKEKKKEERGRKREHKTKTGSANWRNYSGMHIYTGNSVEGKTELYFSTVNELKSQVDKLKIVKEAVTQLTNTGISNAFYLVYTKDGIPDKLVLLPQVKKKGEKFEFKADFVTQNVEVS